MRRLLVVLLLGWLGAGAAVHAQTASRTPSYEVEVLVFETQLPELEGAELWTRIERTAEATGTVAPKEMEPTEDFAKIAEALRADGRYRLMLHRRWVQTAEPKSNAPAVPLTSWDRELDGRLHFYLSRFLHVELNLLFQPLTSAIGGDAAPSYVIREQRRVRSNDLHYFDHPRFGALVRVTPVPG